MILTETNTWKRIWMKGNYKPAEFEPNWKEEEERKKLSNIVMHLCGA